MITNCIPLMVRKLIASASAIAGSSLFEKMEPYGSIASMTLCPLAFCFVKKIVSGMSSKQKTS
jgi:hypothetical protein